MTFDFSNGIARRKLHLGHHCGFKGSSKEISTQRTCRIVAGAKPLVQTRRVEFLLAGFAAQFRKRIVTAVNHGEANHAVLYTLKALVDISLPQNKPIHYASILK